MDTKKPIILNDLEEWDFTDYVDALIDKEEAVDLEFKIAKDGLPNSLWDTYSSFANTDGGVIVLGVKEHKQQLIIEGLTQQQISQYKKDFWNQINNPDCVNENLLTDDDLYEGSYGNKELFDGKVESLTQDELTALVTCFSEGEINNTQLQYVIPQHRSDITRMLKKLCNQGFLVSEGNGRGTKYHVNDPERKVGTSEDKVGTSDNKVGTSKRLKFEELESIIISIAEDYTTLDEIASGTNRTFDYIANKIIPRMLKNGTIEYLYPGVPNHPKQKYKATNKKL